MIVHGISDSIARHYNMDLSVGDFSIPVTEEETDLGVAFSYIC